MNDVLRATDRYPSFEDSVTQFADLLLSMRWPTDVVWVRPGDVVHQHRRVAVFSQAVARGDAHARAGYAHAASVRLGAVLDAVCQVEGRTFARIVRPVNADAASRNLVPNGLKLRVPTESLVTEVVFGHLRWWWLSLTWKPWPEDDGDMTA
jgi:hypothetical protein